MSEPARVSELIEICDLDPRAGPHADLPTLVEGIEAECNAYLKRFGFAEPVTVELVDDPTGVCAVQKFAAGYTILVPWGLFFRVTHMARLLLERVNDEFLASFLESPLDGFSTEDHFIPAFLHPALAEFDDAAAYMQAFQAHWSGPIPEAILADLLWIRLYAVHQAVLHELGHIVRGHFALRQNAVFKRRLTEAAAMLARYSRGGVPPLTLSRALEVDADFAQGLLSAEADVGDLLRNGGSGGTIGLTSGLAACILMSVIDAERRQIASYIDNDHLAPVLRFEVLLKASHTTLDFLVRLPQGKSLAPELQAHCDGMVRAHQMFQIALNNLRLHRFEDIENEADAIRAAKPGKHALAAMSGLLVGGPGSAIILEPIIDYVYLEYQVISKLITDECWSQKQGLTVDILNEETFQDLMSRV